MGRSFNCFPRGATTFVINMRKKKERPKAVREDARDFEEDIDAMEK